MIRHALACAKLLIATLALAATLERRVATADETLIPLDHGAILQVSDERIVAPQKSPRRRWYVRAEALALRRHVFDSRSFAAMVTETQTRIDTSIIRGSQAAGHDQLFEPGGTTPTLDDSGDPIFVDVDVTETQDPGSVDSVLGTGSLPFDFRSGGLIVLGYALGDWHATEVSYFGLNTWNEAASVSDLTPGDVDIGGVTTTINGTLFSPLSGFGNPATVGLDYNNFVSIRYSSQMDNLEWNLRCHVDMPPGLLQTSVLIGGRYMSVREQFDFYSDSDAPAAGTTNSVITQTGNEMVGFQMGALFEFQVDHRCWVDCEIKGAIFDNGADQDTVYQHSGDPAFQGTHVTGRAQHRSAFALDLSLMFTCQIGSHLSAHAGYQALWIDGLALATENFNQDANVLINGPGLLVANGRTVYHGPRAGVTWIW